MVAFARQIDKLSAQLGLSSEVPVETLSPEACEKVCGCFLFQSQSTPFLAPLTCQSAAFLAMLTCHTIAPVQLFEDSAGHKLAHNSTRHLIQQCSIVGESHTVDDADSD